MVIRCRFVIKLLSLIDLMYLEIVGKRKNSLRSKYLLYKAFEICVYLLVNAYKAISKQTAL